MRRAYLGTALGMLLLAGCKHQPPKPTPDAIRPTVTRAILHLKRPFDIDAHGDVVIPRQAITHRSGMPGVFVLSVHGRARFRLIKVGTVTAGRAEILSGLSGDEILVLPPFRGIYNGSPVQTSGQPQK